MKQKALWTDAKTNEAIASEWDRIASMRDRQLRAHEDLSFDHVLRPTVLEMISDSDRTSVLDCGCGTGVLTESLALAAARVTGVDMSKESVRIARSHARGFSNLNYVVATVEEFAFTHAPGKYTLIVANMFLMGAPKLPNVIRAIADLLEPGGEFVATITHPFFWPLYWEYATEPWFEYEREVAIEAPFVISLRPQSQFRTSHYHRPLEMYLRELIATGFRLVEFLEPMPKNVTQKLYPEVWQFPRFAAFKCSMR